MSVGTISPLKSGGVLVDVGDDFPIWRATAGEARSLLLARDLMAADLNRTASDPGAPDTTGAGA